MIDTVQMSKKAIELRRLGLSYSDIAKQLKVSKTSVSNWVKNVRLTEGEKINLQKNLKGKVGRGRMMASISIRSKKVFKEKVAYEKAEKDFAIFNRDPIFILGLGLCLSHGLKNGPKTVGSFQFVSSDQYIIKIILNWMDKYLNFPKKSIKYKLFIDILQKNNNFEQVWSKITGVPVTSFGKTAYLNSRKARKDKEYKGSLAIIISRVEVIRRVIAWQKLAIRYYG
jgi:transcriptional regulator with XRE-family HTH domain